MIASKPPEAGGEAQKMLPQSPGKEPTLPTPSPWTSGLRNCETTSLLAVHWSGSLQNKCSLALSAGMVLATSSPSRAPIAHLQTHLRARARVSPAQAHCLPLSCAAFFPLPLLPAGPPPLQLPASPAQRWSSPTSSTPSQPLLPPHLHGWSLPPRPSEVPGHKAGLPARLCPVDLLHYTGPVAPPLDTSAPLKTPNLPRSQALPWRPASAPDWCGALVGRPSLPPLGNISTSMKG